MNPNKCIRNHFVLLSFLALLGIPSSSNAENIRKRFIAHWSTQNDQTSHLLIRNAHLKDIISVKIRVVREDGTAWQLEPREISPTKTEVVIINDVVSRTDRPKTTGSVSIEYDHPSDGVIFAEVSVSSQDGDMAYTVPGLSVPFDRSAYGIFSLQDKESEVYAAITNPSNSPLSITATTLVDGRRHLIGTISLGPNQSKEIEFDGRQIGLPSGRGGGVLKLEPTSGSGRFLATGWIENDKQRYTNTFTFTDPGLETGTTLISPQVAFSTSAGKSLRVKNNSHFIYLFNSSQRPGNVRPTLFVEKSSGSIPIVLPLMRLNSQELYTLDLFEYLKHQEGILNVAALVSSEVPGAIIAKSYSYDDDPSMGFYTSFEAKTVWNYTGIAWDTRRTADTFISILNSSEKPDRLSITLYTSTGAKAAEKLIRFDPNEVRTVSVRAEFPEVLSNGASNGRFGGFRVEAASSHGKFVLKQHVVDRSARSAYPLYGGSGGTYITNFFLDPSQITLSSTGSQTTLSGTLVWSDAYQEVRCDGMASSNTSIVTVTSSGCGRTLTAGYAGTTTVTANVSGPAQGGGTTNLSGQTTVQVRWTLNLAVSNSTLTVNRQGGSVQIIASATTAAGAYTGTKQVTIMITAVSNLSGVVLVNGTGLGNTCNGNIAAGGTFECSATVSTTGANTTSGMMTSAVTATSTDPLVTVTNSPRTVTISTNP